MRVEAEALRLQAERARLFDHMGNRGTEAEQGILKWLHARLAPDYVVSSGEIIDSFDDDSETPSRQQDGIVHRNDRNANRFLLPSGLRLVPVESVAAVVEVKLTLDAGEFDKADAAATLTSGLRLRIGFPGQVPCDPIEEGQPTGMTFSMFIGDETTRGVQLSDEQLRPNQVPFAVFGFGGVKGKDTLVEWVMRAKAVNLVCCLGAGCVARTFHGLEVVGADEALAMFADHLARSATRHEKLAHHLGLSFEGYAGYAAERMSGNS